MRTQLQTETILKVLDHYVSAIPTKHIGTLHDEKERVQFLKALSIKNVLSKEKPTTLEELIEKVFKHEDEKKKYNDNDEREFKEVIGA